MCEMQVKQIKVGFLVGWLVLVCLFFFFLWNDSPAVKHDFQIYLSSWTVHLVKPERCLFNLHLFKHTAGVWPNQNSRRENNMLCNCISLEKPIALIVFLESSVQNTAASFNLNTVGN